MTEETTEPEENQVLELYCEVCGEGPFSDKRKLNGHMLHHRKERQASDRDVEAEEQRQERVPVGVPRRKLTVGGKCPPNKVRRWFNDKPGRIEQALDGGYAFVRDKMKVGDGPVDGNQSMGQAMSRQVGTEDDGRPITAYLMEIDRELHEQDQAAKQAVVDRVDQMIGAGKFKEGPGDNRYVPPGGIRITSQTN